MLQRSSASACFPFNMAGPENIRPKDVGFAPVCQASEQNRSLTVAAQKESNQSRDREGAVSVRR